MFGILGFFQKKYFEFEGTSNFYKILNALMNTNVNLTSKKKSKLFFIKNKKKKNKWNINSIFEIVTTILMKNKMENLKFYVVPN